MALLSPVRLFTRVLALSIGCTLYRGDSLREIPFSHGAYLRDNGARERSIIQFTDLLSHWLSLRVIRETDSSGKQFLDKEFIFYIFVFKYLDDRSGEQYSHVLFSTPVILLPINIVIVYKSDLFIYYY